MDWTLYNIRPHFVGESELKADKTIRDPFLRNVSTIGKRVIEPLVPLPTDRWAGKLTLQNVGGFSKRSDRGIMASPPQQQPSRYSQPARTVTQTDVVGSLEIGATRHDLASTIYREEEDFGRTVRHPRTQEHVYSMGGTYRKPRGYGKPDASATRYDPDSILYVEEETRQSERRRSKKRSPPPLPPPPGRGPVDEAEMERENPIEPDTQTETIDEREEEEGETVPLVEVENEREPPPVEKTTETVAEKTKEKKKLSRKQRIKEAKVRRRVALYEEEQRQKAKPKQPPIKQVEKEKPVRQKEKEPQIIVRKNVIPETTSRLYQRLEEKEATRQSEKPKEKAKEAPVPKRTREKQLVRARARVISEPIYEREGLRPEETQLAERKTVPFKKRKSEAEQKGRQTAAREKELKQARKQGRKEAKAFIAKLDAEVAEKKAEREKQLKEREKTYGQDKPISILNPPHRQTEKKKIDIKAVEKNLFEKLRGKKLEGLTDKQLRYLLPTVENGPSAKAIELSLEHDARRREERNQQEYEAYEKQEIEHEAAEKHRAETEVKELTLHAEKQREKNKRKREEDIEADQVELEKEERNKQAEKEQIRTLEKEASNEKRLYQEHEKEVEFEKEMVKRVEAYERNKEKQKQKEAQKEKERELKRQKTENESIVRNAEAERRQIRVELKKVAGKLSPLNIRNLNRVLNAVVESEKVPRSIKEKLTAQLFESKDAIGFLRRVTNREKEGFYIESDIRNTAKNLVHELEKVGAKDVYGPTKGKGEKKPPSKKKKSKLFYSQTRAPAKKRASKKQREKGKNRETEREYEYERRSSRQIEYE